MRIGLADHLDDGLFGLAVHLADEVVVGLFRDRQGIDLVGVAGNDGAGAAGSTHGDVEHRMHGIPRGSG